MAQISVGVILALVGDATVIAGVVKLVRAKRIQHHSSQPPLPGTDHYEMMVEEVTILSTNLCWGITDTGEKPLAYILKPI